MPYDLLIHSGLVIDGSGGAPVRADVAVKEGRVVAIGPYLDRTGADRCIDATGRWVTPGFVDNHTHYDAEVLLAPGLGESVRHGVTTVCIGSCSLGTVFSSPRDCADLFSRVEAVPHDCVMAALQGKHWSDPGAYAEHLDSLALGPNVMAYVGHSDMRTAVMGLERSTDRRTRPTREEQARLDAMLEGAIDEGFLGLSCMTNPWDKVGGTRARSRPLPSTFATWGEYRRLHGILRRRGAVLQSAPNITTKVNALLYLIESAGFGLRKALKTTLITIADTKSDPWLSAAALGGTRLWERLTGSDLRWQSLPVPFEVYADGVDLVVFEEFGAGEEALHLTEEVDRNALFSDPAYRRRFRRDLDKRWGPRVWHRDLHDAQIVSAPDPTLAGRSFGEVADERGDHPADTFLDLVVEHGKALRWRTTLANHRPRQLAAIVDHENVHIGFSDAGAHLRNMAFYNVPLHMLRRAARGELALERAVHRVTGEIADWYGVDAGHLRVGDRADVIVVDPQALDERLDAVHEEPVEAYGGLSRMVRRNEGAVVATVIGGEVVFAGGAFAAGFGVTRAHGRFLRRGVKTPARTRAEVAA